MGRGLTLLSVILLAVSAAGGFELPVETTQCVVGVADGWNSSHATLSFYEKRGAIWRRVGDPWPARLGSNGLVWGLGMHPLTAAATTKREGDGRGYAASVAKHPKWPYHQIGQRDLWVEDPASPNYNRHLLLDHVPASTWENQQQMKQDDPAHALKLFIAHNAPPKVAAHAGSAIFFHIWRADGGKPTAGCTTMAEVKLRDLISHLDPARKPVYVLLPKAEYAAQRAPWKLP